MSKDKDNPKSYIKKKDAPAVGFRTSDHFKGSIFSGKQNLGRNFFIPNKFKQTQHKGGGGK